MKNHDITVSHETVERMLDEGELIKLRLEMVFQAISRKQQKVRMPLADRLQLRHDLATIRRN